jgi:RNA polymerase sigma-70 factor (ECF subfamily)
VSASDAAEEPAGAGADGSRLARAFRDGSEEAFAELVELYRERLYRLAYRLTGSADDALDVVQDAFYKVYKGIDAWNERSAFYSWLYRVATNLAIDRLRRRRKDRVIQQDLLARGQPHADDPSEVVAERGEALHRLAKVRRGIEALPEIQRAVMVLRHYEGLSLKEIAEQRGVALGTIKSTLHQAFRNLTRSLGVEASGGPSE